MRALAAAAVRRLAAGATRAVARPRTRPGRGRHASRAGAAQPACLWLHAGGPGSAAGTDGARWGRATRLDGNGHAAGGAVTTATAPLRLFQATVRAGYESAARCDP